MLELTLLSCYQTFILDVQHSLAWFRISLFKFLNNSNTHIHSRRKANQFFGVGGWGEDKTTYLQMYNVFAKKDLH